jgi:hypothetical protein
LNAVHLTGNVLKQWEGNDAQIKPLDDITICVDRENLQLRRRLMQLEAEVLELRQALERKHHRVFCGQYTYFNNVADKIRYTVPRVPEFALNQFAILFGDRIPK